MGKEAIAYSIKEVALMVNVSCDTIRRAINANELRSFRPGRGQQGKIMVSSRALEDWITSKEAIAS